MSKVLALDEGTTSARAFLYDEDGTILAFAQRPIRQSWPNQGWVEQDPMEIWNAQLSVAETALERAEVDAKDVAAVGITNQRETTVLWERATGRPVAPAIVWQDRRTAPHCERLRVAGKESLIRRRTGLCLDPYFSATKIAHVLETVPDIAARAAKGEICFGTIDSWLLWNLTNGKVHATDPSNASRTLLFDIAHGDYDPELCDLFGVPLACLPRIVSSSGVVGTIEVGKLAGIPIAGLAGDQQSALFGQMCDAPGSTKCTYGTGCFMLQSTGSKIVASTHGLLTTVAWKIGDRTTYALEGSVLSGGSAVQWLRDGLGIIEKSSDIEALAASVSSSDGVVFVPAMTGLGAPNWDPYARGMIHGISPGTTAAHIARATLEGIAHQVADLSLAMRADCGVAMPELLVDGGAASNDLLMEIQADFLGVPVVRPRNVESTAFGAACLAGLGVGLWSSIEDVRGLHSIQKRFTPRMVDADRERLRMRWREGVARAKKWELP